MTQIEITNQLNRLRFTSHLKLKSVYNIEPEISHLSYKFIHFFFICLYYVYWLTLNESYVLSTALSHDSLRISKLCWQLSRIKIDENDRESYLIHFFVINRNYYYMRFIILLKIISEFCLYTNEVFFLISFSLPQTYYLYAFFACTNFSPLG